MRVSDGLGGIGVRIEGDVAVTGAPWLLLLPKAVVMCTKHGNLASVVRVMQISSEFSGNPGNSADFFETPESS